MLVKPALLREGLQWKARSRGCPAKAATARTWNGKPGPVAA
jgi:hypothetical protein